MKIRPISDLRNHYSDVERDVREGGPVFLTKNGYGSLVVMSMETYEERMRILDAYAKLAVAEEEVSNGEVLSPEDSMKGLKEKYGL